MKYRLDFANQAKTEIKAFKKSNPTACDKVMKLLKELANHPFTGTGKPERLKYRHEEWSRRITGKHRLIYAVDDETATVKIISVSGHYENT